MRHLFLACFVAGAGLASAAPINIVNHSFEDPALGPGSFTYSAQGGVPGWTFNTRPGGSQDIGVWYTGAVNKVGNQIGFVYSGYSIAQALSHVVLPETTYTLDYLAGYTAGQSLIVELFAGGTVASGAVTGGTLLATKTTTGPGSAVLDAYQLTFTTGATGAGIGETLSIRVSTTGSSYAGFDHFLLDATPVPEPATLSLVGLAAAALARRKRRA